MHTSGEYLVKREPMPMPAPAGATFHAEGVEPQEGSSSTPSSYNEDVGASYHDHALADEPANNNNYYYWPDHSLNGDANALHNIWQEHIPHVVPQQPSLLFDRNDPHHLLAQADGPFGQYRWSDDQTTRRPRHRQQEANPRPSRQQEQDMRLLQAAQAQNDRLAEQMVQHRMDQLQARLDLFHQIPGIEAPVLDDYARRSADELEAFSRQRREEADRLINAVSQQLQEQGTMEHSHGEAVALRMPLHMDDPGRALKENYNTQVTRLRRLLEVKAEWEQQGMPTRQIEGEIRIQARQTIRQFHRVQKDYRQTQAELVHLVNQMRPDWIEIMPQLEEAHHA